MAKELANIASSIGTKRKDKPSKKRRDRLKKKLAESYGLGDMSDPIELIFGDTGNIQNEVSCKKFILIDEPMTLTPLGVQFNYSPCEEPLDDIANICTLDTDPVLPSSIDIAVDEYAIINSEYEVDQDIYLLMKMKKMML